MGYQAEKALEGLSQVYLHHSDKLMTEAEIIELSQVHATLAVAETIAEVGNRLIEAIQILDSNLNSK